VIVFYEGSATPFGASTIPPWSPRLPKIVGEMAAAVVLTVSPPADRA
jgi:hypothetical protein